MWAWHRAAECTAFSGEEPPEKKRMKIWRESAGQTFSKSRDGRMYTETCGGGHDRACLPKVTRAGLPSTLKPPLGWNSWKHIEVNNAEWGETAHNITELVSLWFTGLFFGQVKASSVAAATKVGCVTRSSKWREKRWHFLSLVSSKESWGEFRTVHSRVPFI